MPSSGSGHAFISYVREDKEKVDRVTRVLQAAGVDVWRDTEDLFPGDDWRLRIRDAITGSALAFIACFSENSATKHKSYQNEELLLAVDQIRLRPPEQPWLIPLRFNDCDLPQYDLGGGRTLDSLHRVDLIGENWDAGAARLVAAVLRILERAVPAPSDPVEPAEATIESQVKSILRNDARQIELDDLVTHLLNDAMATLKDRTLFPSTSPELTNDFAGSRFLVQRANRYWTAVLPVAAALSVGCAWGNEEQSGIWRRAIERIASTAERDSGQTALLDLRRYPILPLLYSGGLAAAHRANYQALRAIAQDAVFRGEYGPVPMIAAAHVWRPFAGIELTPQLLAVQTAGEELTDELIDALTNRRRGRLHTPVSDHLHGALRDVLLPVIPDDADYTETFDRLEVVLALVATDVHQQLSERQIFTDGAWYGSFTWRDRFAMHSVEERVRAEFEEQQQDWPPLRGGLFGRSVERAAAAFEVVTSEAARTRSQQF
jgi:hypothetical protein